MSRLNSIRNLATSGLTSGLISGGAGAAIGGAVEGYSGGNIMSGMASGALAGVGARAGSALTGRAGRGAQAMAIKSTRSSLSSLPRGKAFLNSPMSGRAGIRSARAGLSSKLNSLRGANFGRTAGIGGGVAGGVGGFAMLSSNRTDRTFAQSSLNDRQAYLENVRKMQMNYNMQEAAFKKQLWQQGK